MVELVHRQIAWNRHNAGSRRSDRAERRKPDAARRDRSRWQTAAADQRAINDHYARDAGGSESGHELTRCWRRGAGRVEFHAGALGHEATARRRCPGRRAEHLRRRRSGTRSDRHRVAAGAVVFSEQGAKGGKLSKAGRMEKLLAESFEVLITDPTSSTEPWPLRVKVRARE